MMVEANKNKKRGDLILNSTASSIRIYPLEKTTSLRRWANEIQKVQSASEGNPFNGGSSLFL